MEKLADTFSINNQQLEYISTRKMLDDMMLDDEFSYPIKISARPLIRRLQERYELDTKDAKKIAEFENLEEQLNRKDGKEIPAELTDQMEKLFSFMFPVGVNSQTMGLVTRPFTGRHLYSSPEFQRVFLEGNLETPVMHIDTKEKSKWRILEAGIHILNQCYGQELDALARPIISTRDKETQLERHFKMEFLMTGIDVIELKPKKKLTAHQIQELLTQLDNPDLWLEYLPVDRFAFEGLMFLGLTDVTGIEINSNLRGMVLENDTDPNPLILLPKVIQGIRSILKMPDLQVGFISDSLPGVMDLPPLMGILAQFSMSLNQLLEVSKYYKPVLGSGKHTIVSDLKKETELGPAEEALLERGMRSLLFLPMITVHGEVVGLIELASSVPNMLNQTHILKLADVQSLMAFGLKRTLENFDQQIDLVIQEQFTSIHPSVEWKFKEIATEIFLSRVKNNNQSTPEPIVFEEVNPLYGQADIVGSSSIRNRAIQADLMLNLELVMELLHACQERVNYPLLDAHLLTAERYHAELSEYFVSSHESLVVEFLNAEVHPFLQEIREVQGEEVKSLLKRYFAELDTDLHIIYRDRKDYENSVGILNDRIGTLLEKSNGKMQKTLPHFFECFKTDGVEYNMYVGASLSPAYPFSDFQLKNIRLWQLVNMCEITRLVYEIQGDLPVPLQTAQLIFVYNNSLSIRFHMDEKQFDVDGAYNVRYEIIKKRIDKAMVKGKNERLTLKGKIAIVYLQEKDKKEYLDYLDYLLKRGYITEEIEDLDLEKLQGVEGLRALRVTVKEN